MSPTRRRLVRADIDRYAEQAFGGAVRVRDSAELSGGGFAAVWRVDLSDGRRVVLKVGPPPDVPLLRYEAGLIPAEAHFFRTVAAAARSVPVPPVLHQQDDWLVTGHLPGVPLAAGEPVAGDDAVRRQLGAAVAELHTVTGSHFGYDGPRAHGSTWREAFAAIIDDLLADAADWRVPLPVPPPALRATITAHADVLDTVDRPALVHFDLWDGNVLSTADVDRGRRLSGLVDGERYLYGDPLVDFVSTALFRRIEDEPGHPFLLGYTATTGRPVAFDVAVRRRLTLYRIHLYLLMLVEMPSRGMDQPGDDARRDRLTGLLTAELRHLQAL